MLDEQTLDKRINEANDMFISDAEEPAAEPAPQFVDLYQGNSSARIAELKKTRPNGSTTLVKAVANAMVAGDGAEGLAHAHKRARDDSDLYKRRGEIARADMAKRQYMEEHFLPAIETVIRYTSPDELLNSKEALKTLDQYALGTGKMDGYTASYVRQAYGDLLGQDLDDRFNHSDGAVRDAVCQIKSAASGDKIRNAVGIASRIKRAIDSGEYLASEEDYEIISRVAAYGS